MLSSRYWTQALPPKDTKGPKVQVTQPNNKKNDGVLVPLVGNHPSLEVGVHKLFLVHTVPQYKEWMVFPINSCDPTVLWWDLQLVHGCWSAISLVEAESCRILELLVLIFELFVFVWETWRLHVAGHENCDSLNCDNTFNEPGCNAGEVFKHCCYSISNSRQTSVICGLGNSLQTKALAIWHPTN